MQHTTYTTKRTGCNRQERFAQLANAFSQASGKAANSGSLTGILGKGLLEHTGRGRHTAGYAYWGAGRLMRTHHDSVGLHSRDRLLWALFGRGRS